MTTFQELQAAAAPPQLGHHRGLALLDDMELFDRIANRIARHHDLDREQAGRALDQALVFVVVAGQTPDENLSVSPHVDIAWDTFILYTSDYTAFCERYVGRYVHHEPNDNPHGVDDRPRLTPRETAQRISRAGYWVEWDLWEGSDDPPQCYDPKHGGCGSR